MHICFICTEIFAWGKHGGFGRATRIIGKLLAQRGIQTSAVVPRRGDQPRLTELDGIQVYGMETRDWFSAGDFFSRIDADIYHSQEPSFNTYLAQRFQPTKKHLVTFRDTRTLNDWLIELRLPSLSYLQVLGNQVYEDNFLVHRAVRNADGKYGGSHFVARKALKKYRLKTQPELLPTPVAIPDQIEKSDRPLVIFNSRWDPRKRPEIFFNLARHFPSVKFLAIGKSRTPGRDEMLREEYSDLTNLEFVGFIDQFDNQRLTSLLNQSWILVNTAAREGLPNSFFEGAASKCAILSAVDPDAFASEYGYHAKDDDFVYGLNYLLQEGRWKVQGQKGYEYVKNLYAEDIAIDQHIKIYQDLLSSERYD